MFRNKKLHDYLSINNNLKKKNEKYRFFYDLAGYYTMLCAHIYPSFSNLSSISLLSLSFIAFEVLNLIWFNFKPIQTDKKEKLFYNFYLQTKNKSENYSQMNVNFSYFFRNYNLFISTNIILKFCVTNYVQ